MARVAGRQRVRIARRVEVPTCTGAVWRAAIALLVHVGAVLTGWQTFEGEQHLHAFWHFRERCLARELRSTFRLESDLHRLPTGGLGGGRSRLRFGSRRGGGGGRPLSAPPSP